MGILDREAAVLVLADGTVFRGYSFGAQGKTIGEVVFNTSMSGYQEILTDPSYAYQLLTFTCPHIGNVGTNFEDMESSKIFASGAIVKDISPCTSNFRSESSLPEFMKSQNTVGIAGVDTRALVLHLRNNGSQMGIIASGDVSIDALLDEVRSAEGMEGKDLASEVSTTEQYSWSEGNTYQFDSPIVELYSEKATPQERIKLSAIDFGIKHNILRLLTDVGFDVTVLPATTSAEEILALGSEAVFLSNGPGDPAAVGTGIQTVKDLLGKVPIFGICLGHQILGLASGVETYKLKFGHRGGNHPVKNIKTGEVEISVQNHGFASNAESLPAGVEISHINLNDNTVEGLVIPDANAFSVQFHPESSPGPHDSSYHFEKFRDLVRK